jgi:DNA-binding response OmpR family regulator
MQISVLLIEDDPDYCEFVKLCLSRPDARIQFELHWASTLSAGLEFLSKSQVDAVVVDLGLPDSNGPETVGRLTAITFKTPFVALSAEDRDFAMWEVMSHGAEDHLVKADLNPDSLKITIVNAIARHLERTTELAALHPMHLQPMA